MARAALRLRQGHRDDGAMTGATHSADGAATRMNARSPPDWAVMIEHVIAFRFALVYPGGEIRGQIAIQ